MKRKLFTCLALALMLAATSACGGASAVSNTQAGATPVLQSNYVELTYFFIYETGPCVCYTLAREWVDTTVLNDYNQQVSGGKLVYKKWDAEDPANAALVAEFKSPLNSIYVTVVSGEERNTTQVRSIWLYLDTSGTNTELKTKFINVLKKELDKALALI